MNTEILIRTLAELLLFLELTDEQHFDDRSVLKMLESATFKLNELDVEDREHLDRVFRRMAEEVDQKLNGGKEYAESLRSLTKTLGLIEGE